MTWYCKYLTSTIQVIQPRKSVACGNTQENKDPLINREYLSSFWHFRFRLVSTRGFAICPINNLGPVSIYEKMSYTMISQGIEPTRLALKCLHHLHPLGSNSSQTPAEFYNDWNIINTDLMLTRLCKISRQDILYIIKSTPCSIMK